MIMIIIALTNDIFYGKDKNISYVAIFTPVGLTVWVPGDWKCTLPKPC